jgi:hypothetical protein
MFILGEVLETPGDFGNPGRFWKPGGILETCQRPIISLMSQKKNGAFGKSPDFPKVPPLSKSPWTFQKCH